MEKGAVVMSWLETVKNFGLWIKPVKERETKKPTDLQKPSVKKLSRPAGRALLSRHPNRIMMKNVKSLRKLIGN